MKKNLHPAYARVAFRDTSTGATFVTRSTIDTARRSSSTLTIEGEELPVVDVEITNDSHPFWTGRGRVVDSEGRVEKFERRYGTKQAEQ